MTSRPPRAPGDDTRDGENPDEEADFEHDGDHDPGGDGGRAQKDRRAGWNGPEADRPRLYPVPDDVWAGSDGEPPVDLSGIPLGNSPQEPLEAAFAELDQLASRVAELTDLVGADGGAPKVAPGQHQRFRFERHPAGVAAAAHAELARWVSWLVATYQLTDTVPPCWDRHDALAEELAGFHVAWQSAWADQGRDDAAVAWHDQLHRATAGGRWAGWLRGIRCGQSCSLDADLVDAAHTRWAAQAADTARADGGAGAYRLARAKHLAPPIPAPTRTPKRRGASTNRRAR